MGLQKKAVLIASIILFLTIGINTAVLTVVASNKYKKAILSKTSTLGESLRVELEKVLDFGIDIDSLEGASEKLSDLVSKNSSVSYAFITDVDQTVLYHNNEERIGQTLTDRVSIRAATTQEQLTQASDDHYDLSFPLLDADDKMAGVLRVGIRVNTIRNQLYMLLLWAVGISSFCFLISIFLVYYFVSKHLTRPIVSLEKVAEKIASGELTHVIDIKGKDEIASLGTAINSMAQSLRDIISRIRAITDGIAEVTSNIIFSSSGILEVADSQKNSIDSTAGTIETLNNSIISVANSSGLLASSAEDTSTSILEMKRSIESVAENTNLVDESSQETSSSIEEMVANIKQIADSIGSLSLAAENVASSADEVSTTVKEIEERANESVGLAETVHSFASDEGQAAVNAAIEGMENIKESVRSLSENIDILGKRSEDIGKILNVINEVTDQTTLLSLNAAILAAQAGEQGKSFAVVSDSIKSLANRTSQSTREISDLIASVQSETKASIKLAADGIKTVEKGMELVQGVHTALGSIVESSTISTEMSKAIQRATSEQTAVIHQITQAIKQMTEQVEHISLATQEQNKGSTFILNTTEKLRDISHQVKLATGEQQEGSLLITDAIENITKQVEQIVEDTTHQMQKSSDIVKSIDSIKASTSDLIKTANEMSATVNSLQSEGKNLASALEKFIL